MKALGKVFNEAKNYLTQRSGYEENVCKTQFICIAINQTSCSERSKEAAKEVITSRLGKMRGSICDNDVESWLRAQEWCNPNDLNYASIQQYRHRWLQSLVAEFK